MNYKKYITESSISRIVSHIKSDRSFGVVSAFRDDFSHKENIDRHNNLKTKVRSSGYGFIDMKGGYKGDQGFVEELSLFIPNVSKNDILKFGKDLDQHSVIFKDSKEFALIGTNKAAGIGKVLAKFDTGSRETIELAKDAMENFFSSLLKGAQRGRKFLFRMQELFQPSLMERAYANATPTWKVIYEYETTVLEDSEDT